MLARNESSHLRLLSAVLGTLLVAATGMAGAATLDIYPDGSGPYANLEQALWAAQSGDTLRLADGIFTGSGNRNLLIGGLVLTILSASGDAPSCILDLEGDGRGLLVYSTPGTMLRVEGLTLRAGDPRLLPEQQLRGYGGGLAVQGLAPGGMVYIESCIFDHNSADAGGGIFLYEAEASCVGCIFHDNSATDGGGAYCGYCTTGDGADFHECVFYGDGYPYLSVGGYGAGIYFSHAQGEVASCTFAENSAWIGAGLLISTSSQVVVEGSLIAFSLEGAGLSINAGEVEISRSDIFGNEGGDWIGPIADRLGFDCNVSVDPVFCDPPAGDFTLREDSPCLPENSGGCGLIGALPQGCTLGFSGSPHTIPGRPNLVLLPPSPNPSATTTAITFALAEAGNVRLRVLDPSGRVVATLLEDFLDEGEHVLRAWRGRDAEGRSLPAGAYLLHLEMNGRQCARRAILMR